MELWMTALAAWKSGDQNEAKKLLELLLTTFPHNLQARHLYGVAMTQAGDYAEAIKQLHVVCEAEPCNDEALSNLGNAQRLAGQLVEAEVTFRSGLVQNRDNPNLHFNLGIALKSAKRLHEAEAAFQRASELDPSDQASWFELGLVRYARSDHWSAASAFLRAGALDGEDKAQAIRLAGFALADGGRPEEAERLLASLCPERPQETKDFHLLSQLLYCRMELCDWRQVPEIVERCKQFIAEGMAPLEPFTFLLLPEITAQEQLTLTANFVRSLIPTAVMSEPVTRDMDPARRLRIGYLSADFHDHAVMRLLTGVLEHHNHVEFEIHAFSYGGADEGEMRRRIAAACDYFHDVSVLSPELMARRINAEAIDILIDITGWTGNTKSAVLGFRPAPIQVNWLGYTGTFGNKVFADYLIGDPIATPLSDQDNFAEKLALMPVCCQPNDAGRRIGKARTREEEGLPESSFVFCCFSRPLKITSEMFRCWCELLTELPESVLWLLAANETAKANLVAAAKRCGIEVSRLVFSPACPPDEHLARLSLADLSLDTFPFGAHTTASDSLWAGLPVVTILGETFPSRVTASMLNAVGLNELVAHSIEEYRALALELARNPELLMSIRNQLKKNRSSSRLFDTEGFSVELEALLRAMWRRHCLDT
ncbi:MAG: tetratricopeptide repeat protein [Rhodocyclales bacterium]|nr:tetratricopeptide repeat protein [Rhodocyclales bacterium]